MNTWFFGAIPIARFNGKDMKPALRFDREESIIHVSDVLPLMKSKFALADDGDLDAMEAVEGISDRPGPNRWSEA